MDKKFLNDWEMPIAGDKINTAPQYNLEDIYDHAHSELSLQQSKRDQIITIYLALCSFLLPFALGKDISLSLEMKGLLFLMLGLVGVLFSLSVVRYREYKEVYWLCCQTITVLQSIKAEEIKKQVIQNAFYFCLKKKGEKLLNKKGRLNRRKFVKGNMNSTETLHCVIIVLMAAFISGLGVALLLNFLSWIGIIVGAAVGVAVVLCLMRVYFRTLMKIYLLLEDAHSDEEKKKKNDTFNSVFKKAWFLHFYYDEDKPKENTKKQA